MKSIAANKKAIYDLEILDKWEAGIILSGAEVKSVKQRQVNLKGSYVVLKDEEPWLINTHISPYQRATFDQKNYDPTRSRKLLLNKKEIKSLIGKTAQKGLTLIPLRVYTKHGLVKIEIGLGRGKKQRDKRAVIKKREVDRKIQRALRQKY